MDFSYNISLLINEREIDVIDLYNLTLSPLLPRDYLSDIHTPIFHISGLIRNTIDFYANSIRAKTFV